MWLQVCALSMLQRDYPSLPLEATSLSPCLVCFPWFCGFLASSLFTSIDQAQSHSALIYEYATFDLSVHQLVLAPVKDTEEG